MTMWSESLAYFAIARAVESREDTEKKMLVEDDLNDQYLEESLLW